MKAYTYTKDDGTTSDRVLHIVGKPPAQNFRALDLTGIDPVIAQRIEDFYGEWVDTVDKPYKKKENEFRKANLESFEDFLRERGIDRETLVKSFKAAGLVEAE